MKKILIILALILTCGCTSTYKLEIGNNSFKENIDLVFQNTSNNEEQIDPETGEVIESDNPMETFTESNISALISEDSYYRKKIEQDNEYTKVNLKYTYDEKKFLDSSVLNLCFEKSTFNTDKTYYIHVSGKFYCYYGGNADIEIISKNKIIESNAHEVIGNRHIWHINEENIDNVDILFNVEKGISQTIIIYVIFLTIILFIVIYVLYNIYSTRKKNNSI